MSDAVKERVVLAPNPSALTGQGTNSFLLGTREVAVIDPGPDVPAHLDAIVAAAGGRDGSATSSSPTRIWTTAAARGRFPG